MFIDKPTVPIQLEVVLDQIHALRQKNATSDSIQTLMQPSGLPNLKDNNNQAAVHLKAARDLGLVVEDEEESFRLAYAVREGKPSAKSAIISGFDRLVLASSDIEPWFGRVYSYVIARDENGIPPEVASRKVLCTEFNNTLPAHIERTNPLNDTKLGHYVRWFCYVGLGWKDPSKRFVPDPTERLSRSLPAIFEGTQRLDAGAFMAALAQVCPELDGGALFLDATEDHYRVSDRACTGALALALRNLHEEGVIELDCPKDSQGWSLERGGTVRDQRTLQSDRFDRVRLIASGEHK